MPAAIVNGVRVSYRVQGEGDPLLLIGPAASPAAVWDRHQVPDLVRAGFQVITFDLRGSAPSDAPPGPYALDDLVTDTAELIRHLGIEHCLVAGVSIGAMIAQELARAHPELVGAIALMATRGRSDVYRDALAQGCADAMRAGDAVPVGYSAVATMGQLFGPGTLADDKFAEDWLTTLSFFPQRGEGFAAQYEATVTGDRLPGLRGIRCPSLVLAFAHDLVMPPAMGRAVADVIPDCRFELLEECGHFGFLERPEEVNRILVDFFRSVV
ncbi:alpha/beta fold hydrolase [Streptomyces sp. NBC_01235]|uniref:alpha/beta fold hydrolase n=1 Tax=Streptomyces sp. NBC_01235 TaxID=2903788 RepID=UPI002E0F5F24|nr:alpha/beta hydrolase [Streptomyces sp. NBC_01235]